MLLLTQPRSAPSVMNRSQADGRRHSILAVGEVNIDLILSGLARLPEFGSEALAECLQQGHAAGDLMAGSPGNAAERLSPAALAEMMGNSMDN